MFDCCLWLTWCFLFHWSLGTMLSPWRPAPGSSPHHTHRWDQRYLVSDTGDPGLDPDSCFLTGSWLHCWCSSCLTSGFLSQSWPDWCWWSSSEWCDPTLPTLALSTRTISSLNIQELMGIYVICKICKKKYEMYAKFDFNEVKVDMVFYEKTLVFQWIGWLWW